MDGNDAADARSAGCFAADVLRASLDPMTGRTLSFNQISMAVWAGHLCDLVLAGVLVDNGGSCSASGTEAELHPLVEGAWQPLERSLPRQWRWMFAPAVIDINKSAAQARTWLVQAGFWSRRRTLLGSRYTPTAAPQRAPIARPPGDPTLRRAVLDGLIAIAKFGAADNGHQPFAGPDPAPTVRVVLQTTHDLIAWKAGNPPLPGAGTGGLR